MGTAAGQSPPGDTGTPFDPARRWGETDSRRPSGSHCDRARTKPLLDRRRFCTIRRFAMGESVEPIVLVNFQKPRVESLLAVEACALRTRRCEKHKITRSETYCLSEAMSITKR